MQNNLRDAIRAIERAYDGAEFVIAPDSKPNTEYVDQFASRGSEQWVYGELTDVGSKSLLDALLAEPWVDGQHEELFVDIGSGAGRVVLLAAALGCHSVGD